MIIQIHRPCVPCGHRSPSEVLQSFWEERRPSIAQSASQVAPAAAQHVAYVQEKEACVEACVEAYVETYVRVGGSFVLEKVASGGSCEGTPG